MPRPRSSEDSDATVFRSQRILTHAPRQVFEAFERPELLARWWGPSGFTNTFEIFEFRCGGRWKLTMHGPNGSKHPNESVFLELTPASALVIQHVSPPRYVLAVTLTAHEGGRATVVGWTQTFEDRDLAARLRPVVEPANEQNLDRLQALLREEARGRDERN